ncbi:MAG TPA: VTT domain-containing protein [Nitriliruptoraceae bacterium]|nr:VTT domain-containing protein [Nitriliruptoraceae bacterium]
MPTETPPSGRLHRWRHVLLGLAIARYAIPIAALPLIPVWLPDRIIPLMLVRPGREIQLAAGGLARTTGEPNLFVAFLAFLPLMLAAVWVFFFLGRAYRVELTEGEGAAWLNRVVPPETFAQFRRLLKRRGPMLAFLGRIGALPPTIMAAAAGTSDVNTTRYLAADAAGAVVGYTMTVGVGYALGSAYERGGWWLTVAGLLMFVVVIAWISNWLRRETEAERAESEGETDGAVPTGAAAGDTAEATGDATGTTTET